MCGHHPQVVQQAPAPAPVVPPPLPVPPPPAPPPVVQAANVENPKVGDTSAKLTASAQRRGARAASADLKSATASNAPKSTGSTASMSGTGAGLQIQK